MKTIGKVSAANASKMIEVAVNEAERLNKSVVVSIAGPEGELIAFLRMDGANAASGEIAQNKAYTSARDRKSTMDIGKKMREKNYPPAFWGDLRITGFGGGLPIIQHDTVIGGIGVSGLSQEEDERLAALAIKAVYPV